MSQTGWSRFTVVAIGLIAGAWMLTGCPKQPSNTADMSTEQVKPPSAGTSKSPDTPSVENPAVREQEIAGAGKVIDALKPVYFDYDRSDIRDDMKPVLAENAKWLKTNTALKVQIEGHCDERGTNEYNLALGERRASAIKRYLSALGVPAGRLSTISYGEERPACGQHEESCWHLNRRGQFAEAVSRG